MNPDAWDDFDYRGWAHEFYHWRDKETGMSLRDEEQLYDEYYGHDEQEDPEFIKKEYSARDLEYNIQREASKVSYHYEERIKKLNETISKMKEAEIAMAAKIAKVQKMEELLDRYALHSEIDYDKETYEFINYDERN